MSSTEATTSKNSFSGVPTVTILVGENSRPFSVHRDQLCEASSFFKAAFEGAFREGSEMKMSLPEEEEHTFDLFIQWLYNRSYEISPEKDDDKGQRFMEPVKLYVLADKYDVTILKSHVITKIFELVNQQSTIDLSMVAYAYEHTPQDSHLRKLLADWLACKVDLPWFSSKVAQEWLKEHPEVASAVISSFARTISRKTQKNLFVGVDMLKKYKGTKQDSE